MQQNTSGYKLKCRICITSGRIPYTAWEANGTVWIEVFGPQHQCDFWVGSVKGAIKTAEFLDQVTVRGKSNHIAQW